MKKLIIISLAIIISFITAHSAFAETSSHMIHVSARVSPYIKHSILHQNDHIVLTSADIDRGYIDVNRGIALSLKTNSKNGYLLVFAANSSFLNNATVYNENNTYNVSGSGGEVHMPYPGKHYVTKELSFRFHLSATVEPGTYAWPLALMLTVL